MEESKKTAIIAFHDPMNSGDTGMLLEAYSFENKIAHNINQMREIMNSNAPFDAYIMDVNLGYANSANIDSGLEIYGKIKDRLEKGETKFFAVSANDQALEKAVQEGIPQECVFAKNSSRLYDAFDKLDD